MNFSPFDYVTTSNNVLSNPPLHKDDEVFIGLSEEELIPLPLYKDMLDETCPLMLEARFLDTDRTKSLIETIHSRSLSMNKKNPQKEEDDEISDEQEDEENEDDESAYDSDDDED